MPLTVVRDSNTYQFGIFMRFVVVAILYVLSVSCNNASADIDRLPLQIAFVQGDDGQVTSILHILVSDGHRSAFEVETNNFTQLGRSDTIRADRLNDMQIRYIESFLKAFAELPGACVRMSSATEELTVSQVGYRKTVTGNCDWGDASYYELRRVLFGGRP
jgi:hypothetical protein